MDFNSAVLQAGLGFKMSNGTKVFTGDGQGDLLVYIDDKLTSFESFSPSAEDEQADWAVVP